MGSYSRLTDTHCKRVIRAYHCATPPFFVFFKRNIIYLNLQFRYLIDVSYIECLFVQVY